MFVSSIYENHPQRVAKYVDKTGKVVELKNGQGTGLMPYELTVQGSEEKSNCDGSYVHAIGYSGAMADEFLRLFANGDASKLYIKDDAHYEAEAAPNIIAMRGGKWVMGSVTRQAQTTWQMISSMGSSEKAQLEQYYSNNGDKNITLGWGSSPTVSVKASFTDSFRRKCVSIGPFGDTGVGKSTLGNYFGSGVPGRPQKKNVSQKRGQKRNATSKRPGRRGQKRNPKQLTRRALYCHTGDGKTSVTSRNTMIDMPFLNDMNRMIGFFDTTGMNDTCPTRDSLNLVDMHKSLEGARETHGGLNVIAMQYESTQKRFNRSHQEVFQVMANMFGREGMYSHMAIFINCMGSEFTKATIRDDHAKKFLPDAETEELDDEFLEFAAEQLPDLEDDIYDGNIDLNDPQLDAVYLQVLQMWKDKITADWQVDLQEKFDMKKYRKDPVPVFFFMPIKNWSRTDDKFIESVNRAEAERLYAYAAKIGKFRCKNIALAQRKDDLLKANLNDKERQIAEKNVLYKTLKQEQHKVIAEKFAAEKKAKEANEAKLEAIRREKEAKRLEDIAKRQAEKRRKEAEEQTKQAEKQRKEAEKQRKEALRQKNQREKEALQAKQERERQDEELKKEKAKGEEQAKAAIERERQLKREREEADRKAAEEMSKEKAKQRREEEGRKRKQREEESSKKQAKRDEERAKAKEKEAAERRRKQELKNTFNRERIQKIGCQYGEKDGYSFITYLQFTSQKEGTVRRGVKGSTNWIYMEGPKKGQYFDGIESLPSGEYVTEIYGGHVDNDTGSFLRVHTNGRTGKPWFYWRTGSATSKTWSNNMWRNQKDWSYKAPAGSHIRYIEVLERGRTEKIVVGVRFGKLP